MKQESLSSFLFLARENDLLPSSRWHHFVQKVDKSEVNRHVELENNMAIKCAKNYASCYANCAVVLIMWYIECSGFA